MSDPDIATASVTPVGPARAEGPASGDVTGPRPGGGTLSGGPPTAPVPVLGPAPPPRHRRVSSGAVTVRSARGAVPRAGPHRRGARAGPYGRPPPPTGRAARRLTIGAALGLWVTAFVVGAATGAVTRAVESTPPPPPAPSVASAPAPASDPPARPDPAPTTTVAAVPVSAAPEPPPPPPPAPPAPPEPEPAPAERHDSRSGRPDDRPPTSTTTTSTTTSSTTTTTVPPDEPDSGPDDGDEGEDGNGNGGPGPGNRSGPGGPSGPGSPAGDTAETPLPGPPPVGSIST